jgi:hypothetical protein
MREINEPEKQDKSDIGKIGYDRKFDFIYQELIVTRESG